MVDISISEREPGEPPIKDWQVIEIKQLSAVPVPYAKLKDLGCWQTAKVIRKLKEAKMDMCDEEMRIRRERESRNTIACYIVLMAVFCAIMFFLCPLFGVFTVLVYLLVALASLLLTAKDRFCGIE